MSIRRFFSATARDAMKLVRAELGDEAVILSNRAVDGGVEVIASAAFDLREMIDRTPARVASLITARGSADTTAVQSRVSPPPTPGRAPAPRPSMAANTPVAESFAHFVQRTGPSRTAPGGAAAVPDAVPDAATTAAAIPSATQAAAGSEKHLMAELHEVKSILKEQIGAFAWRETIARRPLQARLTAQMLAAGFSPGLSRAVSDKLPADYSEVQADHWLQDTLTRNVLCAGGGETLVDKGGIYALVGPTGVGKTTTAAKLAALCVLRHGPQSLGLITVDNYRIGAEDQLRSYGTILGITVHTAHDARTLRDLLTLMRDKHLVLIDTVGMSQRDKRVGAQLAMLDAPGIERVLFMNAGAQGETLDDVVRIYAGPARTPGRKAIVSKIDEAVKYGAVLDCLIRHRLEMQYVTNGQRVPEDVHCANAQYLVHRALNARLESSIYTLSDADVPLMLFAPGTATAAAERAARNA